MYVYTQIHKGKLLRGIYQYVNNDSLRDRIRNDFYFLIYTPLPGHPPFFYKTMNLHYFCNLKKEKIFPFWEEKGDNKAKLPKTKLKINQTRVAIPPLPLTICAPGQTI